MRSPPGVLNADLGLCTRRPVHWRPCESPGRGLFQNCRLPSGLTRPCCLCSVASMLVFQGQVLGVRSSAGFSLGWWLCAPWEAPQMQGPVTRGGSQGSFSCRRKDTLVVCVQRTVTNGIAGQASPVRAGCRRSHRVPISLPPAL